MKVKKKRAMLKLFKASRANQGNVLDNMNMIRWLAGFFANGIMSPRRCFLVEILVMRYLAEFPICVPKDKIVNICIAVDQ